MPSLSSISGFTAGASRNLAFGSSIASSLGNGMVSGMQGGAHESPVSIQEGISLAAITNSSPDINQDPFWGYPQIELKRWNKLYPYQLLVLSATIDDQGETTYSPIPGFQYTLPFPPESLSLGMPIASTVEATLGGIFEQNNKAPFRDIQISGSMGTFAARGSSASYHIPGSVENIFGGVISDYKDTIMASLNVGRVFNSEQPLSPYSYTDDDFDNRFATNSFPNEQTVIARGTGYYQLKQLEKFLEAYVNAKGNDSEGELRLAWANWKDYQGQVTLVTPLHFGFKKQVPASLEYTYSIILKGWKRVPLHGSSLFDTSLTVGKVFSVLGRVATAFYAGARLFSDLTKLPQAIMGGLNSLLEPVRIGALYSKIQLGQTLSLADLPESLKASIIAEFLVKNSAQASGNAGRLSVNSSAIAKTLSNPTYDQLASISINSLGVSSGAMAAIQIEKARVGGMLAHDFKDLRSLFKQAGDTIAASVGVSSQVVNDAYGVSYSVSQQKNLPSDSDWEILWAIDDCLQAFDILVSNTSNSTTDSPVIDSMVQLTRRLGVAFQKPASKFAVPLPYKMSLPQLASTYLNNVDRWVEIAVLNGLKPPYIDEEGYQSNLLVNGSGHKVTVVYDKNLYVNQLVFLGSGGASITRHHIVGLKKVGETSIVTLDGDTVEAYKLKDQAYLHVFLPDTTNSQSLIYIPSDREPLDNDVITTQIPGVDQFDPLVAVGGIDLQLDLNNDIVIGTDGDARYVAGLANIIQWTRVVMSVPLGQLQLHKGFGIAVRIGDSTAEIESSVLATSIRNTLIRHGLFSSIDSIRVSKKGPVVSINTVASVYGYLQPIPISYQIKL